MAMKLLASENDLAVVAEFEGEGRRAFTRALQILNLGTGTALVDRIDVGFEYEGRERLFTFSEWVIVPAGEAVSVVTDARLYDMVDSAPNTVWDVHHATATGGRTFAFHVLTPQGRTRLEVSTRQDPTIENNEYRVRWYMDVEPRAKDISPA